MSSHGRIWLAALAAVALLAASAHALNARRVRTPTSAAGIAQPAATVPASVRRYNVELGALTNQRGERMNQRVSARLALELAADGSELWRLENVVVSAAKNDEPAEGRPAPDAACRVQRGDSGRPATLLFGAGAGFEQRRLLEYLVALAQTPPPGLSAERPSPVEERDGTGSYQATYTLSAGGAVQRSKQSYDAVAGRGTGLRVISSLATLGFAGHDPLSIDLHEQLEFESGALTVESSARVTSQGDREPTRVNADELAGLTRAFTFGEASHESEAEEDVALAQGLTPENAAAAVVSAATPAARRDAVKRLVAVGHLNPGTLPAVSAALQRLPGTEPAIALLGAVSRIGGSPAVSLLSALARDPRQPERLQREAIASLNAPHVPAGEAFAALSAFLPGAQRMTTALQLGLLARSSRQSDPALGARVTERLWSEYRQSANRGERALLIDALGNAGALGMLDELPNAACAEAVVRAHCVYALRHVPGAAVEKAVSAALHDADVNVRRRALAVCSQWGDERPCAGLESVVLSDRDADTRERALHTVLTRARSAPERARATTLTERVARTDAMPRLRELATHLLERLRLPEPDPGLASLFNQNITNGSMP